MRIPNFRLLHEDNCPRIRNGSRCRLLLLTSSDWWFSYWIFNYHRRVSNTEKIGKIFDPSNFLHCQSSRLELNAGRVSVDVELVDDIRADLNHLNID